MYFCLCPSRICICPKSHCLSSFDEEHISSSIMDNFHYYNSFKKEVQADEKFYNNHGKLFTSTPLVYCSISWGWYTFFRNVVCGIVMFPLPQWSLSSLQAAHTDSGLLTVVVVTDVPGLEIFDQQIKKWIALEDLLHQYLPTIKKHHRQYLIFVFVVDDSWWQNRYATIFWADSVTYLKTTQLQSCMHRVGKSGKERYSVVFKQRTAPLRTACRCVLKRAIMPKAMNINSLW